MFHSEIIYSFTFKTGKMKISSAYLLHCHGSFVLTLKEVFQRGNFQLRPRKSVRCKEVSTKNCPLRKGFLIRTLYETNPFLKKVSTGRRCPL